MNPNISYGLWVIMTCQCWFINCNKCTTIMRDFEGTCVRQGCIWKPCIFCLILCEPKTKIISTFYFIFTYLNTWNEPRCRKNKWSSLSLYYFSSKSLRVNFVPKRWYYLTLNLKFIYMFTKIAVYEHNLVLILAKDFKRCTICSKSL